jgi:UDP-N-acetylmuramate: L-alanyl-gamma-D-glutamyl-meso-diaminopimelate ligase
VFEPRSYTSRTRLFQEDFAAAFQGADLTLVAAAHMPGKVPEALRLSEVDLARSIREKGSDARFVPEIEGIVVALSRELRSGDLVVVLSNGSFGGIHEKLLAALES